MSRAALFTLLCAQAAALLLTSPAAAQPVEAGATSPEAPATAPEAAAPAADAAPERAPTPAPAPKPAARPAPPAQVKAAAAPAGERSKDAKEVSGRDVDPDDRLSLQGAPETKLRDKWTFTFGGYIRAQYVAIQDDPEATLIGRNDGFVMANARPFVTGEMKDIGLGFRMQLELAAAMGPVTPSLPQRPQVARPRDMHIYYDPIPQLEIQLGQFKAPFDAESLQSTGNMLFVNRSVGNIGVDAFSGRDLRGLEVDREVGVQVLGRYFFTSEGNAPEGPGISYALAVTNGAPAQDTFNDNDALAMYGRLMFHYGDIFSLGGAALLNDQSIGEPPDRIEQRRTGFTGDVQVHVAGVHAFASFTQRRESTQLFAQNVAGQETFATSRALQAQIGYEIPKLRITPAYRFAMFDPTADYSAGDEAPGTIDQFERDALTYHTFGLSYIGATYPIRVMLNYTVTGEDAARELTNNRFDALVQLTF